MGIHLYGADAWAVLEIYADLNLDQLIPNAAICQQ